MGVKCKIYLIEYRNIVLAATIIFNLFLAGCQSETESESERGHDVLWGYTGEIGPEHWGELADEFIMCSKGKKQSPINLTNFVEEDLMTVQFNYHGTATEIANTGHSIQVNYAPRGTMMVGEHVFELKQFHFHAPSEHMIEGKSFAMEAHLVHADKDNNLAVISVMFEHGADHSTLEALWKKMPEHAGDTRALKVKVDPVKLLPNKKGYYRYVGSLTTPPCREGVWWLIMKEPVKVSKQQVEAFSHVMHHSNNRPVQPVNSRLVLQ